MVEAFVTRPPTQPDYSPSELDELAVRKRIFCDDCSWEGKISCSYRFSYVGRKGGDVLDIYRWNMGMNTCNTSEIPRFQ